MNEPLCASCRGPSDNGTNYCSVCQPIKVDNTLLIRMITKKAIETQNKLNKWK